MVTNVRFSDYRGFTIVEFLVAILILMVGMLALLQSVNLAIEANSGNKKRAAAAMIADQAMMRIKSMPFASISTGKLKTLTFRGSDNVTTYYEYENQIKKSSVGLGFVSYSVYEKVNTLAATTKNVKVNVSWRDKGGRKSHSLVSVIGNSELN